MRVLTQSIKNKLPMSLIEDIWDFYDEGYINVELDDYQYFKIYDENGINKLKMWQEVPPVFKIKSIPHFEECEVWIINDGHVITMLFPEEY